MSSSAIALLALLAVVALAAFLWSRSHTPKYASIGLSEKANTVRDETPMLMALTDAAITGDADKVRAVFAAHDVPEPERARASGIVYFALVGRAVADDEITDEESAQLTRVREVLSIEEKDHVRALEATVLPMLKSDFQAAVADRRLTPDEIRQFEERSARLKVKIDLFGSGVPDVERFKRYALWEMGQLPTVSAPVALQRNESCHMVTAARWMERKTERKRVGYSGFSYSVPIVKGLNYRVGTVKPVYDEREVLKDVDAGTLVFTSSRVIFVGSRGSKSFKWATVLSVTPYTDAIEIARATGKHPVLMVNDAESAAVMAAALSAMS